MIRRKRKGNYPKRRLPLQPIHYRAIELLTGWGRDRKTLEECAAILGVNRRTVYRWRQRKDFQLALQAAIERKMRPMRERLKRRITVKAMLGDMKTLERVLLG